MSAAGYIEHEIEHLRSLYQEYAGQTVELERYAVLVTGGIWSWYVANRTIPGIASLLWVPVLTTVLFGLRAWGVYGEMTRIARYLHHVERSQSLPDGVGWLEYTRRHPRALRVATAYVFWGVLHVVAVMAALSPAWVS